ncbi:MAG: RNA pyrophosphohydrolase [Alphaproteobacteria bacterium]|nr:RNA pyrophosphohydrolase [Alphaproteobacteria bacterium]
MNKPPYVSNTMTSAPESSNLPYRISVGLCIFNPAGLVLIAERRDSKGAWQMPQGGVQKGEDPCIAAFREMKEEVGTDNAEIIAKASENLRYEFPDYMQYKNGVFKGKYRGQEQIWFALRFLGTDADIDLSGENEPEYPEFISWRWAPLDEAPNLIVPFKRAVYTRVVEEFAPISQAIRRQESLPTIGRKPFAHTP